MKLLYCKECHDVFNLNGNLKTCTCSKSGGKYLDNLYAEYYGPCIPLGFANMSFVRALSNQPSEGQGEVFTAFVIPYQCETMRRTDG